MITKIRRERLDKLATYLEGLPEDYKHFDMDDFMVSNGDDEALAQYARHNGGVQHCGTAACAIGHGPSAGILFPEAYIEVDETYGELTLDWFKYCELFIGSNTYGLLKSDLFEFLFSSRWWSIDNHHWGAAARIRYVLAGNKVPNQLHDLDIDSYSSFRKG